MLIGYMRVSKADGSQVFDLQRDALLVAGVEPSRLYQDHASGKKDDRPGLEACLKSMREDDTLIVWKLDRLGRNLRHLVNTIHELMDRQDRLPRAYRPRSQHRHHDRKRPAGVWDIRRAGGIRTRADPRENNGGSFIGAGARAQRRPTLHDDAGQTSPGASRDGRP